MSFESKESYIDIHGAITQHVKYGGDEGDSAFFCGHQALLSQINPDLKLTNNYKIPVKLFFPFKDGRLCRHRKARKPWIRAMDRGSRDQYTPWICFFALRSKKKAKPALKDIAKLLLRRLGFFTNIRKNGVLEVEKKIPDFVTPETVSVLLRGLIGKWGYPLYYLFDAWLVLDALWTRYAKDDNDVANYLAILLTSNLVCPTMLSRLALRLSPEVHYRNRLYDYFTLLLEPSKRFHMQNPWWIGMGYRAVLDEVRDDAL